jgi:hypothetical protein
MNIASIGIDLGKTSFHLVALDDYGKVVIEKKFSRKQLLAYTANIDSALVGIEACSRAYFIGAALRDQGHDVRLIPAQFAKPFVKSNKLRGQAFFELDAKLDKNFKLGERVNLQIVAQAFNLTNRANYGNNFGNSIASSTLGHPIGFFAPNATFIPRSIWGEFGVHLTF